MKAKSEYMDYYLGIDSDGTYTRAVLVTAKGDVHATGQAGPANYHKIGLATATANLRAATATAWDMLGLPFQPAAAAFLGCAGVKSTTDIAQLTFAAGNAGLAPIGKIIVSNDLHNALAGGLAGRPGIALIAGAGTNCLGRDASGATFMCGGWGWLLDDEGGGTGLAIAAMRAVTRAARRPCARHPAPACAAGFSRTLRAQSTARVYVQPWTPDQLAAFTPVVVRLAGQGDATAIMLIAEGALARLVQGSADALDFPAGPEVVILGGCARSGPPYQSMSESCIRAAVPGARIVEPVYSTTHGAALNALRVAGITPLPALRFSEIKQTICYNPLRGSSPLSTTHLCGARAKQESNESKVAQTSSNYARHP